MDFECRRCVTIEDIVHCFGDWQIHVVALIEVVNALGAVIAVGEHGGECENKHNHHEQVAADVRYERLESAEGYV